VTLIWSNLTLSSCIKERYPFFLQVLFNIPKSNSLQVHYIQEVQTIGSTWALDIQRAIILCKLSYILKHFHEQLCWNATLVTFINFSFLQHSICRMVWERINWSNAQTTNNTIHQDNKTRAKVLYNIKKSETHISIFRCGYMPCVVIWVYNRMITHPFPCATFFYAMLYMKRWGLHRPEQNHYKLVQLLKPFIGIKTNIVNICQCTHLFHATLCEWSTTWFKFAHLHPKWQNQSLWTKNNK